MFQIPNRMPSHHRGINERRKWIEEGMFAFVSWKWVIPLAKFIGKRKCLEVMAGRGILSYALQQKGINVIARMITPGTNEKS